MEDRQHALLQLRLQVDEHVTAHDEVHLREGRIGGQIVPREDAELAHRLADLMLAVQLHEEAPEPRRRDIELDVLRVDPGARLHDRDFTDVGSEQLDRDGAGRVPEGLEQHNDERVGFLSRRTPRRPDADRRVRRPLLDDARKDAPLQGLERFRIPEKSGHVHEQVVAQRVHLGGVPLEVAEVALERVETVNHHAPGEAACDRRLSIQREIDAALLAQHPEDLVEGLGVGGEGRGGWRGTGQAEVGMATDPRQLLRDGLRWQDEIDRARGHGAPRHPVELRRLWGLRERDAALSLDRPQPECAVGRASRENHADRPAPHVFGERAQKVIDRHVRPPILGPRRQVQDPVGDGHADVRRHDVHTAGLDAHAVRRLDDRHPGRSGQDLGQDARVLRVEVLDQHEAHRRLDRQMGQQLRECLQPARGGPDAGDRKGIFRPRGDGGAHTTRRGHAWLAGRLVGRGWCWRGRTPVTGRGAGRTR